jgi:hypothetical protein
VVPELVLDGVRVVRTGCFKDLLEVIFGPLGSSLEIAFDHCHKLIIGVVGILPDLVVAGQCSEAMWSMFFTIFPPLAPFLVSLMVLLVGVTRPLLVAILALPWVKVALTAALPEACRVVMSGKSLVFCGFS